MNDARSAVSLLIALAPLVAATPAGAATPHPAVCRVSVQERDGQAFGSGTLIDAREQYGLVVTNWHVVRDAVGKIEVRFPSGAVSEARPLKLDETWDLAALVVWRPPTEPVPLAAQPPRPGDELTICGYGQGDYRSVTGRCTDYYSPEVGQPQELVELNVEARQGDSGGPIFNARGELAGVLFGAGQGTTLGSFGGRVQTFLATLAPDIGAPEAAPTLIARAPQPPSPQSPRAIDPFLAAERAVPAPSALPSDGLPAVARVEPVVNPAQPPPSLADRSSAPRLAASRREASEWQSAAASRQWFDSTASTGTARFAPESSAALPPTGIAVDWYEDGRTLLALFGVAAIVVAGLRSLS